MPSRTTRRAARTGAAAAAVAIPLAAAYGFAVEYRRRAGFPTPRPLPATPDDEGLPWESLAIPSPGGGFQPGSSPPAAVRPARGSSWCTAGSSSRARMLPNARFLHAAGFHTLLFDVRGHGENPPEVLPISGGEFGADAAAAVAVLRRRPEVTSVGLLGHSMGAVGAVLAAASEPGIAALVATAIPAHPRLLTRRTFELAGLRIPGPVALPLAWLTMHVYLRPRGHRPGRVNALRAIRRLPRAAPRRSRERRRDRAPPPCGAPGAIGAGAPRSRGRASRDPGRAAQLALRVAGIPRADCRVPREPPRGTVRAQRGRRRARRRWRLPVPANGTAPRPWQLRRRERQHEGDDHAGWRSAACARNLGGHRLAAGGP